MNPYYEDYLYNRYLAARDMPPGMPSPTPMPTPMPGPMPGPMPTPMPGPMPGPRPPRPPQPRPPRPPMPRPPRPPVPPPPRPPRPIPVPLPVPVPIPGPYNYRPLNVYLCRYFNAQEGVYYCSYTVAYGDQLFPIKPECNTFVAGPFYTMRDADAYIESLGVRRGQVFIC